jgi:hypothetical protein
MGQMMLLPEERDLVRREFSTPTDLMQVARSVQHREARLYLFYQAVCAALADNKLVDGEVDALLSLAETFSFRPEHARSFIRWVRDSLEVRDRGQQLLVEM